MKRKIVKAMSTLAVVLVIPTQYGTVSCTASQVREYIDAHSAPVQESTSRQDQRNRDRLINAMRNAR